MKGEFRMRLAPWRAVAAVLGGLLLFPAMVRAQAAPHLLGTVTAVSGNTITVKTAQGEEKVDVPSSAQLKRIEPGQTNLNAAVAMQFSELAVGDRVLVNLDPNASSPQAVRVVAIKQSDVEKQRAQEQQEWAQGVGGLVKSVDPAAGTILLSAGAGPTPKMVTIHTTQATVLKRYAPASVSYAMAQPASFDAIHAGDQLMARGQKNADGSEMNAAEVVSGSFRNISGTINSVDAASSSLVVKDLATKKPVTIHVTPETQMRRLPERMAQFLAARLKGTAPAGRGGEANGGARPRGETGQGAEGGGGMDPQQLLSRAPTIHIADLQKGEAVMLVATQGAADVTAITFVAGVEPLLEAPASQNLLANWSMGSSAPSGDAGESGTQP
jgi:hypothetical protein